MVYGWVIVGAFSLMMAITWGTTGSFGLFVNPLTEDMGWSRTAVSAAASTLLAITFTLGVVWGWLSDRWSVRGVIILCGALIGLGFFLASTVHAIWQLYLFYGVIGGIGLGGVFPSLTGLTARWFDRRRGLAIGIGLAGVGVGIVALPPLAEYLTSLSGWRLAFQVFGVVIWGATLSGAVLLREPRSRVGAEASGTSSSNPRSRGVGSDWRAPDDGAPGRPAGGRAMPLSMALRTSSFWHLFGMLVVAIMILHTILVHLVPRAIDAGVTSSTAATLLPVLGILSIVGKVAGGALGDRIGHRRVFIASVLLQALMLLFLTSASHLWEFYLFAAAFGLGYGGWATQPYAIATRIFGSQYIGAIAGALQLGAAGGGLIGPTMAGYVFDTTGSYGIAFNVSAGIAMVGILLALLMRDGPRERWHRVSRTSR